MAFTEWIGILPVIVPVMVMDLRRVFVILVTEVSGISHGS